MKNAAKLAQPLLKPENTGSKVNSLWTNGRGGNMVISVKKDRLNTAPSIIC
jgi:ketol-acid reductoisomerase